MRQAMSCTTCTTTKIEGKFGRHDLFSSVGPLKLVHDVFLYAKQWSTCF